LISVKLIKGIQRMRGGPRDGAGRKKGSATKRTQEIAKAALAEGTQPLEYMLNVMRDPGADEKRRDQMAIAAASFVHPRLAAVTADVKADVDATHHLKLEAASEVARRLGRIVERGAEDEGAGRH
jgi:hypothetical protein